MYRERALIEAQAQLISEASPVELLRARVNLCAAMPGSPLIPLLDDRVAHLRTLTARKGEAVRRREHAFPSL